MSAWRGGEGPTTGADVRLRPVDATNWRGVDDLEMTEEDRRSVAEPGREPSVCGNGAAGWRPLGVLVGPWVVDVLTRTSP